MFFLLYLIELILDFTLEAKLVQSKPLTQVHLKISSRTVIKKLGFTPDDKVYCLKHFRGKSSVHNIVRQQDRGEMHIVALLQR